MVDPTADSDLGERPVIFRSIVNKTILSCSLLGGLILFLSGFAAAPELPVQILCGGVSIAVAYYLVRALRFKVTIREDGVRIDGFYRSRFFLWKEIKNAEVIEFPSLLPWFGAQINKVDGGTVKVLEVAYLGRITNAARFVALVNAYSGPPSVVN